MNAWYSELLKPTDWLLVAFTGLLAVYTRRLYEATASLVGGTNKTLELARQEFLSTHRPRIILREAIIGSVLEGGPITVFFQLANVGETNGTIIRSSVRTEVVARGNRLLLHANLENEDDLGQVGLKPGTAILIKFKGETPKWQENLFQEKSYMSTSGSVTYRDATIHFVGQLLYTDEAGTLRRTGFRRQLIPERQRFYRIPDEPDLDYSD